MKEKRGDSSSQEFKADVKEALDSFDQEGSELKKRMEKIQKEYQEDLRAQIAKYFETIADL